MYHNTASKWQSDVWSTELGPSYGWPSASFIVTLQYAVRFYAIDRVTVRYHGHAPRVALVALIELVLSRRPAPGLWVSEYVNSESDRSDDLPDKVMVRVFYLDTCFSITYGFNLGFKPLCQLEVCLQRVLVTLARTICGCLQW